MKRKPFQANVLDKKITLQMQSTKKTRTIDEAAIPVDNRGDTVVELDVIISCAIQADVDISQHRRKVSNNNNGVFFDILTRAPVSRRIGAATRATSLSRPSA